MNYIVFDIETKNFFPDVGANDPALLDLSVVCVYDSKTDKYMSFLEEDLPKLWPILESADLLIGFNSDHFDTPLLNKYYSGDLTKMKSIDLMKTIQETLGRRIGLGTVAEETFGAGKSAHGSQAMEWWAQGKYQEVIDYCIQDVKITKDLYEHMKAKKPIKYKDRNDGQVHELLIDISGWDKKENSGATFTLGF